MQERLHKLIARAGLTSRRRAEELIVQGRVQVNGRVVKELGAKADPERDVITVDGRELPSPRREYYLLHKPRGYVTTVRDPQGRPTVIDLVPARTRLFPVGRLDLDSEGLLLLTNDGELAYLLTHPRFEVEKVYEVWVCGYPTPKDLQALKRGVVLEDGPARAIKVEVLGTWQKGARLAVTMHEGRKREVRRLLGALGFEVKRLIRRRLGPLELGDLPPGHARRLKRYEVAALYRAATAKAFSSRNLVGTLQCAKKGQNAKRERMKKHGSTRHQGRDYLRGEQRRGDP